MNYIDKVEKVINYIEENLEHEITLEDLSRLSFFSKFHFHKIFQGVVGESVMEYIRKRRISKAALKLMYTDAKIMDIAIEYQFNSQDTFTRAFTRYFNVTPSVFRKKGKGDRIYSKVEKIKGAEKVLDWNLGNRIQCTEIDKDDCIELVSKVLMLSKKAEKYGLLSLEQEVDNCDEVLLKKGIELMVSGTLPEHIKEILGTYIVVGNYTGKELLKRVIILESVLEIQKGENSFIIMEKLSAYFGENYLGKFESYFGVDSESIKNKIEGYFEKVKNKRSISSSTYLLEEIFKDMDSRSIQRVLREIDVTDIVNALKGASGNVEISVLSSLSNNAKLMIIEELAVNSEVDNKQIVESQQKIINIIHELKEAREIRVN